MLMPNSCLSLCDELAMAARGRWRACALKTDTGAECPDTVRREGVLMIIVLRKQASVQFSSVA